MSLSILYLIDLFSLSYLKKFPISLIAPPFISFSSLSNLKRFLTSLTIFYSEDLKKERKKTIIFKNQNSIILVKKRFKIVSN